MAKRRELGLPDENRKKAERLFDKPDESTDFEENDDFRVTSKSQKRKISVSNDNAYEADFEENDGFRVTSKGQKRKISVSDDNAYEADFEENDDFRVTSKSKKDKKSAKAYAVSLLSARTYTESGLRTKLFSKGYTSAEIDEATEYVKSFGYINDMRVAENAAARLASRLYGRRRIFAYLASKGIKSDVINALDLTDIDFEENCRTLAQKYEAKGASYEKTAAALARAGFSSKEIYYAMSDFEER